MNNTAYPVGYSAPGARAYIETLLKDERTILVDTRYSTASKRKPEWSYRALQERYGKRYLWIRELGNINYFNGGPIEIADLTAGIARLLSGLDRGYSLILLCTCQNYETCHGKVVVEALQEAREDVQIVHPTLVPVATDTIACLSIRQPYAHWLSNPQLFLDKGLKKPKTIENRDWNTKYRGPLLLHASATFEEDALAYWSARVGPGFKQIVPMHKSGYTLRAIVGIATLADVVTESDDPWFVGEYGFVLKDARPIEPIPYRGQLKLFPVPASVVAHVLGERNTRDG
jgi:hypothetical protein